ncbi:MAG: tetratricopeptide repeat protein [Candidatus Hodarchaeota archaeon]
MSRSEVKEINQAKQLINEGKFDDALKLMKDFEEKGDISLQDLVSWHLVKCYMFLQQYSFKELIELAEQTYTESIGLGNNLLSVDALYFMGLALVTTFNLEKAADIIKQGEDLLKSLTNEPLKDYKKREANIAFLKGVFYNSPAAERRNPDLALEFFEQSLALREKHGEKHEVAESLLFIAGILWYYKGEIDQAFEYLEHALTLAKENNMKFHIAYSLLQEAVYFGFKGELDLSIKLNEQSLVMFKELNNKYIIAGVLNNLAGAYRMKGELEHALECVEQSKGLYQKLGHLMAVANTYDFLIQILIEKGDLKRAQDYLNQLEQMNIELKNNYVNSIILFNKALMLKSSPRIINKGKAAEIFKQFLEDEDSIYEITMTSLINLCELLLFELNATNEQQILNEFQGYLSQLIDIVKKGRSYWLLAETYLLQARVSLLTLNMNKARRLFAKSQNLAEKYGLNLLAMRISNEHDEFLKQLDIWEKIKDSKAPLAERIELSHLNEQMKGMTKRREVKVPKLEAEQPVLLTIMSKEGKALLSNPFTADVTIDTSYFIEFLTSCTTFCDQILSESFDRVKFGQHTVLITPINSFSICYMFQGQSYSARQKLLHFSEAVKKEPDIMKLLKDAGSKNLEIKVNEIASLEEFIYDSFLSDPQQFQMPFKAYEGDGPFIFVSYSHTDRLQVYPIIDYLNKTGKNIWYDEGIPVSEDWKKSIVENLERCSAFLVFITPHIIDSEYVRKEISFALKKHKPFFSVYLKETELPSELEFEIGNIQFMKKYLIPETKFYTKLNKMLDPVLNEIY